MLYSLPAEDRSTAMTNDLQHYPNVVACPSCGQRIRWRGSSSGQASCPGCHTHFVVLVEPEHICRATALNEDAMDEMICDWLDEGRLDDDWLDDDDPPGPGLHHER